MKKIITIVVIIFCIMLGGIFFMKESGDDIDFLPKQTAVGLLLNGPKDDHSWSQSHYDGLARTAEELNLEIICEENVPEEANAVSEAIDKFVAEGCKVVISASTGFAEATLQKAEEYPDIYFFQVSETEQRKNLSSFFGRIYQMRYLSGIIAGLQTETQEIGYVASFPISEVNRSINAFALGVWKANATAKVHVSFSGSWYGDEPNEKATRQLLNNVPEIDVITMHVNSLRVLEIAEEQGIWSIGCNQDNSELFPDTFLTAPVWQWEYFYTPRILKCLQGKFVAENYWEGAQSNIVSLAPLTKYVKPGSKQTINAEWERMKYGTFDVFYGPITDQAGKVRVALGESMTDAQMEHQFDWYVQNVIIDEET